MTDTKLLVNVIKESGLKYKFIATHTGLSRQALKSKIENKSGFRCSEVAALCQVLNITDLSLKESIFFASDVENSSKFTK